MAIPAPPFPWSWRASLRLLLTPVAKQSVITESLRKQGLALNDINVVFITHAHTDHYRNIGMFKKAKTLDYWGWWEGDKWSKSDGHVSENTTLIKTPGHSYDGLTMLVKTKQGKVAICGDVFWTNDIKHKDPYVQDKAALKKSRKKVFKLADFIVPGHGEMFTPHQATAKPNT